MGASEIEDAVESLLKLKKTIDTESMNEPSFLMVITGTEHALQLKNGVLIVPLGCLKN